MAKRLTSEHSDDRRHDKYYQRDKEILYDKMNMIKLGAKMDPKNLAQNQKDIRVTFALILCSQMWSHVTKYVFSVWPRCSICENKKSANEQVKSDDLDR